MNTRQAKLSSLATPINNCPFSRHKMPKKQTKTNEKHYADMSSKQRLRIDVQPHMLKWAIERSGKSIEQLSQINGLHKISQWMSGESKPTLRQLTGFTNATYVPFGYMFLAKPPKERIPIPHFRTLNTRSARPSINLMDTLRTVKQRQDWVRDYLIREEHPALKFVNSASLTDTAVEIAGRMRKELNMDDNETGKNDGKEKRESDPDSWESALKNMMDRMQEVGVFVIINGVVGNNTHRRLSVEEFRGFVLVDEHAPFVFINGADAKSAQMFTLAHELAHIWLGASAVFDLYKLDPADDAVELLCNRVAAEFLLPAAKLLRSWDRFAEKPDPYKAAAQYFKVSRIVVARRALDLGMINRDTFLNIFDNGSKTPAKRSGSGSGGNFYATVNLRIGRRFGRMVVSAVRSGEILYRDAYDLTDLNRSSFEKYATSLGFGMNN